jgi:hypothetical protein
VLDQQYIDRYKEKEIEYKTLPAKRIYCAHPLIKSGTNGRVTTEPCGTFIGVRQRATKANILCLGRCTECKHMTCMVCDQCHQNPVVIFEHECTGKSRIDEERARAFFGLKRGKDWQQCPNRDCQRRIELSEACNHMSCPCGTGFCFICGKEANGEDDHWTRRNGCPRYNQPDDDPEYDDGSDYDEDEDDLNLRERENNRITGDPVEEIRGLFEPENTEQDTEEAMPGLEPVATTIGPSEAEVTHGPGTTTATLTRDAVTVTMTARAPDRFLPGNALPLPRWPPAVTGRPRRASEGNPAVATMLFQSYEGAAQFAPAPRQADALAGETDLEQSG